MDYVTSNLHASMCEKNKLRVYRELKEVFECKKYLYGMPDMGSTLLFRFKSGTHGLNEELEGISLEMLVKLVFFVTVIVSQ